eukprot:3122383-Pyramimonas_sp.AAC.2
MRRAHHMMLPPDGIPSRKLKYKSEAHRQVMERFESLQQKSRETDDGRRDVRRAALANKDEEEEEEEMVVDKSPPKVRRREARPDDERIEIADSDSLSLGLPRKEKAAFAYAHVESTVWKSNKHSLQESVQDIMFTSYLNILLILIPFAMMAKDQEWGDGWLFALSLGALCPLAERLGHVTEQFASYTNPTVGGLLNATFGNMTEIIVSFYALKAGKLRVVQLSLLGSVLSNLLLVLGCAFLAGGIKNKMQTFNRQGVNISAALLLLAVTGLSVPSLLNATHSQMLKDSSLSFSRYTSCLLLLIYSFFLFFQLITHRDLYEEDEETGDEEDSKEGKEEEEEEVTQSVIGCMGWLAVITLVIAVLSDYLIDAIEGAAENVEIPVAFLSVIVLPIVGNAAEHASAVIFALKNKMDIAIGVAIGSATQISLLVIP